MVVETFGIRLSVEEAWRGSGAPRDPAWRGFSNGKY